MKKTFLVPLYRASVTVVVDKTANGCLRQVEDIFGEDKDEFAGLTIADGPNFAVLFVKDELDVQTVAHEVFHLTHRILEWAGIRHSVNQHEPGAYLNGYLMGEVSQIVLTFKKPAKLAKR